ncbi:hypothetical protein K1T71_003771 [Dendrolimus kikuchii]|uniref:Uncharacterized protein n=1 Tax=Dendrolimus kikuchii TaxID=765133 RepID=A0ACC1DAE1_9NEOP|nr:hypothetical protein K1T71_003771 [Dendrolimus kikuchii]
MQHASSEPELSITPKLPDMSNFKSHFVQPLRRKRRDCVEEDLSDFMTQVKSMFCDIKACQSVQDTKMERICSAVEDIKAQNSSIQTSMEFLSEKYESLKTQLEKSDLENKKNLQHIKALEQKLDKYERISRSACIEIKNVPPVTGESKQDLLLKVTSIAKQINTVIEQCDVKDIYRINTKVPSNKIIIVDFVSVIKKEDLIYKYKHFNKGSIKLNTDMFNYNCTRQPIFISENLSQQMKRLYYLARDYAKSNDYKYCWVTNGKIFLRKIEGAPLNWIRNETDLKNLSAPL